MAITKNLIDKFVEATNDSNNAKSESNLYGTVKIIDGDTFVQIDGSEILTPMPTVTTAKEGDRVKVEIKDHTAVIVGNMSSPSAMNSTVEALDLRVTSVYAEVGTFQTLLADKATIGELNAAKAEITELLAGKVTADELEAEIAKIDELIAKKVSTDIFDAKMASVDTLIADRATIGELSAAKADIINLNAEMADIVSLVADKASVGELNAVKADITNLNANKANITDLDAANANIGKLDASVGKIDTLIFGSASGDVIQTSFANAVIAQLGNAQIKSAMIESVSASKITAGDIITNNVRVMSEDGSLVISDETLQISDGTRVRVQIGKDAANDYSINIWDASGNLMFSKGGITDAAIKNAIIRNDMVAANANISASKLDIDSLFTEINNSSKTIKSTKVYLDEKGQTLDAAFTSMSTDVNGIRGTVESQGTQLSVMQGQIANKIWQTDIDTTIDKLEIGGRNLLKNSRTLDMHSNNPSLYPITATKIEENGVHYVRIKRSSIELYPDSFRVYNVIPKTQFKWTEMTGKTVTLSFKVRASHDTILADLQQSTYAPVTDFPGNKAWNVSTEWTTISLTIDTFVDMNEYDGIRFAPKGINIPSGVSLSDFYIDLREWKFELGNKATDWTPAPEDVEGEISTLSTKYSEVKQTVDGLSTTVAAHTTQISNKADSSTVTTVNNKVSALEQSVDGFKATVSSTYATKSDLDDTNSKLPWATQGWVDASAYDPNYWIPFVAASSLPTYGYGHITVTVALNSGTKPSWSTHVGGFSVEFDVEAKASGWGTSVQEAIINRDTYSYCYSSPVSYMQLGYGSKAILYLRGGGRYYVRTSWATTWTGFPDGYTWTSGEHSQSAPPYATRPTPEGYMYGTKTEINQLSDRITANVSETTALGTRMSTVEQKADGLTVSLQNTQTGIANAAKTATNYLNFSNGGLVVGDMTASTLGNNVLIDNDSVDIRNGTTVVASYKGNSIELGKNSTKAVIDLCSGTAQMKNINDDPNHDWNRFAIESRDSVEVLTGTFSAQTYHESAINNSGSTSIYAASITPWDSDNNGVRANISMQTHRQFNSDSYMTNSVDMHDQGYRVESRYKEFGYDSRFADMWIGRITKGSVVNWGANIMVNGKDAFLATETDIELGQPASGITYTPYFRSGDIVNYNNYYTGGFLTNGGKDLYFSVPLSKPAIGCSTVAASSFNGFRLRQNGSYTNGSSANTLVAPSSYSAWLLDGNTVAIKAVFSSTANTINNTPVGIQWDGCIFLS